MMQLIKWKAVSGQVAVMLLLAGVLIGAGGAYLGTTLSGKTSTVTSLVPTAILSQSTMTFTALQCTQSALQCTLTAVSTEVTAGSNSQQLLSDQNNIRIFVRSLSLTTTNTTFTVTVQNDNWFAVNMTNLSVCEVFEDGGQIGCKSLGSQFIPGYYTFDFGRQISGGPPATTTGVYVLATFQTPAGEFSEGPIYVYFGQTSPAELSINSLTCSSGSRQCTMNVVNAGKPYHVLSGCAIEGVSGRIELLNGTVSPGSGDGISCYVLNLSMPTVGSRASGILYFTDGEVLFFAAFWRS